MDQKLKEAMLKARASAEEFALSAFTRLYFLVGAIVGILDGFLSIFWQLLDLIKGKLPVLSPKKVAAPAPKLGAGTQKKPPVHENGVAGGHAAKGKAAVPNGLSPDGARVPLSRNARTGDL